MSKNLGRDHPAVDGDDEFERRLFAMMHAGDLHFPKGAVRPAQEAVPRAGLLDFFRARFLGPQPRYPRLFLTAAAAYGLAMVVTLPVYLALFPRAAVAPSPAAPIVPPPSPSPAMGSARLLALGAGATRAEGVAPAASASVSRSSEYVVLSFLVPIRSGVTYEASVTDAGGRVVATEAPIESLDAVGNFMLVARSATFSGGEYQLAVREIASPGAAPVEIRRFTFRITPSGD